MNKSSSLKRFKVDREKVKEVRRMLKTSTLFLRVFQFHNIKPVLVSWSLSFLIHNSSEDWYPGERYIMEDKEYKEFW